MTFKEISAWIEAAAVLALYGYYASEAPAAASSGAALGLYIQVTILFVIVVVALSIVAALVHRPEKQDERDKLIAAKSTRAAYAVLVTGAVVATFQLLVPAPLVSAFAHMPPSTLAVHILVLSVAAAELARFATQIVSYRRGA